MELKSLHSSLINKLSSLYGKFDPKINRFKKSSNSEIARELGYGDAQFSRLIQMSATEREFILANQCVNRIIRINELESDLEELNSSSASGLIHLIKTRIQAFLVFVFMLISVIVILGISLFLNSPESKKMETKRDDMLTWVFETSFVSPYTNLDQMPDDCNYPCYKYQGRWELEHEYKLPIFRGRNGYHYLATEMNMYARCYNPEENKGRVFEGYEYQKHEIWYDLRELPLDSFLVNELKGKVSEHYQALQFSNYKHYVKLADIHTFFRDEFTIDSTHIYRKGKVIGRDVELIDLDVLEVEIGDKNLSREIFTEINDIVINRLQDFSQPITCLPANLPKQNFNQIVDGEKISFNCEMIASRMPIEYLKTFVLRDQYIKNNCVPGNRQEINP